MKDTYKLVRLINGPLPETGLVMGDTLAFDRKTKLLKVAVYGRNPERPSYWKAADCRELTAEETARFDVSGWLNLVAQNNNLPISVIHSLVNGNL